MREVEGGGTVDGNQEKRGKEIKVRKVYHVTFFLFGDSSATEFYVPTFRNTLTVPSS